MARREISWLIHRGRALRGRFIAVVLAAVVMIGLAGPGAAAAAPGRAQPPAGGDVLTWGRNQYGQLGNDSQVHSSVPVSALLPEGTRITQVTGGYAFGMALTTDGQVWAWGRNASGQLGDGTTNDSLVPVRANLPAGTTVTAIAAGDDHALALTSTGQLLAWGYNEYGQVGDETTTDRSTPVEVHLPAGTTITAIAAGAGHSLAVTSAGRVLSWGYNNTGQLGIGNTTDSDVPVEVPLPADVTFTAVTGGSAHSTALTSTGQMWSWGYNAYGQLGNNSTAQSNVPVQVQLPAGTTVTAIAGGRGFTSLALDSTGQMLAWGDNGYGQLGIGSTTRSTVPVQVQLPAGTTVTAIAGGDDHSVALTSAGRVLTWGYNRYGQLGDATTNNASLPVEVELSVDAEVLAIGSGGYHGMAITARAPEQTTSTLTAAPQQQEHGGPVTLTAEVSCPAGTPTGTVIFSADGNELGTVPLVGGRAELTVDSLAVGMHNITANYTGDDQCAPSASSPVVVTITAPTGETTTMTDLTAAPGKTWRGKPVTLTARVTCPAGTPTGTVTFFHGSNKLGTAPLANGSATLTARHLKAGIHTITAHYNGNGECAPSTSNKVTVTVKTKKHHKKHVPPTKASLETPTA